jgi:hypothetical protein
MTLILSDCNDYTLTQGEHLEDDWSEPSCYADMDLPTILAESNIIAEQVMLSLQPSIDAYESALKEPELALWQAAVEAFDGKMEIPSKKTIRCYTICKDYQRILILSSSARYEVYKHYVAEKAQFILFYVKHHISSRKTISDDLSRVVEATFLPHCYNISELIQQLDESPMNVEVGIWGPAPLQQAWSMHTAKQMLAIPILDGQPCMVHKYEFEDIPCLYITLK